MWCALEGALKLRDKTREALLSKRGPGATEAEERAMEAETKSNRGRKVRRKKTKRT
jgi:hypothetical protein